MLSESTQNAYIAILQEELVPATGCTEPVSVAYAAAVARKTLGALPERVSLTVSGNILKNVKSVIVPNTGGLKGIRTAAAAGIVAGDPDAGLQVLARVDDAGRGRIADYLKITPIDVACADTLLTFDLTVTVRKDGHSASVRIVNNHQNIVLLERDGEVLLDKAVGESAEDGLTDKSVLNVRDIVEFADTAELSRVTPMLDRQIAFNSAIAEEGLRHPYGACVGRVLLSDFGEGIQNEAKAYAAAGSDARMGGCEMPVVILSGSGNQGMTASLPVIRYALRAGADRELLLRALLVSDLVTIHQKTGIGRLSAFCGAVSAGCGAGAGIAYLSGGGYEAVAHTVVNALAIVSGMVCDGAKPSCAGKIAAAVEAGILGFHMYLHDQEFKSGDGIVTKGVDNTIENVGRLAREGMRETDQEILRIMLKNG